MRTFATALALCAVASVAVAQTADDICDERYDCEYAYFGKDGKKYFWDLAPLCSERGYTVTTADNRTYGFNICGVSKLHCNPKSYDSFLRTGPAVQLFGDTPACDVKNPECTNQDTGAKECCTADCEVLGYGPPIFQLQDESNPTTGGLRIKHIVAPPSAGNPFQCVDPDTQKLISRQVTFVLTCDPNAPIFNPHATRAEEVSTCNYEIEMATKYACGCAPDCSGKTCGGDGCGGYCGGDDLGGKCPEGQTCDAAEVCRDPAAAAPSKGKYTKTPGDVAGGVFGGMFLGVFLFLACYFAYTKGYCAKAWSAVSGKGSGRGFSKMSSAGAGASAGTASSSSSSTGVAATPAGYQGSAGYGSGAKA